MLQDIMHTLPNPYVTIVKITKQYIDENPEDVSNVRFALKANNTPDPR